MNNFIGSIAIGFVGMSFSIIVGLAIIAIPLIVWAWIIGVGLISVAIFLAYQYHLVIKEEEYEESLNK